MLKVNAIFNLLLPFVKQKLIIYRPKEQIAKQIKDFITIKKDNKIIACCGIKKHKNCYELYAFAINAKYHNQGVSIELLKLAESTINGKLFALSKYRGSWFIKNNFKIINSNKLPKTIKYNKIRKPLIFMKNINVNKR